MVCPQPKGSRVGERQVKNAFYLLKKKNATSNAKSKLLILDHFLEDARDPKQVKSLQTSAFSLSPFAHLF